MNEYLQEFKKLNISSSWTLDNSTKSFNARNSMVSKYAWAIPTEEALKAIAKYSPLIEIGAGTGYWAYLLKQMGVDIIAYDIAPPLKGTNGYKHTEQWTEVLQGGQEQPHFHKNRNLLLCWPPYSDNMAFMSLKNFEGEYVIYIGERDGGCNATEEFFSLLYKKYDDIETIVIPQWWGLHDEVKIYRRKTK